MVAKKFYDKHRELFKYYDYNYERYDVPFSVAIIKLADNIDKTKIDFNELIRHSDKYLEMDEISLYFFIFLGTDIKHAYQTLLSLEKKLIVKYNLYHLDQIFCSSIIGKKKDRNVEEMIRLCIELINECSPQKNILTEDDF